MEKFIEFLEKEDNLVVILKTHLYIEAELSRMIMKYFPNNDGLDLTKINFPSKVYLARSLGLFSKEEAKIYVELNNIRNKYGHNFYYEISDTQITKMLNRMKKVNIWTKTVEEEHKIEGKDQTSVNLRVICICLYLTLKGKADLIAPLDFKPFKST